MTPTKSTGSGTSNSKKGRACKEKHIDHPNESSHTDHWRNYIVDEWDNCDDLEDDLDSLLAYCDVDDDDDPPSDDWYDDGYDEWGYRVETKQETAYKLHHERGTANEFVSLIRDVLGGEFHGQEFVGPAFENKHRYKTLGEFRIAFPDTTPRTSHEIWITLDYGKTSWQRQTSLAPSRAIRLFRSGPGSLGDRTLVEYLDAVLNEIVQDVFELVLPAVLTSIISSFCNDSVSALECVAECCLVIGDDRCSWFPNPRPDCRHVSDFSCCCVDFDVECKCDGHHDIAMIVASRVGCQDEYWQLDAMSHDWEGMAVDAFGKYLWCPSFGVYQQERARHIEAIIKSAKMSALSWSEPKVQMAVLPWDPDVAQFIPFVDYWRY